MPINRISWSKLFKQSHRDPSEPFEAPSPFVNKIKSFLMRFQRHRLTDSNTMMFSLREELNPSNLSVDDQHDCLEGTRLETIQDISQWIESNGSNVCLLLGAAGTGKSAIAATLAKKYRALDNLGCYLIFRKGKSEPETVLRNITYSLAMYDQEIAKTICDSLRKHGNLESASLEAEFSTLLKDPLHISARRRESPILVIIDGLDECGTHESRENLMRVLRDGLPELPHIFRFLIAARPEEDIFSLTSLPGFHHVMLDRHSEESKLDVSTYIKHNFERVAKEPNWEIPDDFSWDESIRTLIDAADGLFIWAAAAVKLVEKEKHDRFIRFQALVEDVKSLHLDDLYVTLLEDALDWDEDNSSLFKSVFYLIFHHHNTLLFDQDISDLLEVEIDRISGLLSRFRSLIMYEKGKPIGVYHSSFYYYITSCDGMPWYIDVEALNAYISKKTVKQKLKRHLSKLQHMDVGQHIKVDWNAGFQSHGGYCDVYMGSITRECLDKTIVIEQSKIEIKVAIKRLRVNLNTELFSENGVNYFKTFVKELTVWSKLKHPNVLSLLGYYVVGNYPHFISEWIENGTVQTYVKKHKLPVGELLPILLGIANGLKYIHDNGVIHSDLKADNILINAKKIPLICDFGISRLLDSSETLRTATNDPVTGTYRFMAPELLQGNGQKTRATDIWALGMTYYEIIFNKIPYFQYNEAMAIVSVANGREVPIFPSSSIDLGRSMDCIQNILLLCWTYDDIDRLEIDEIIEALEIYIKIVSGTEPEVTTLSKQLPRKLTDNRESRLLHLEKHKEIGLEGRRDKVTRPIIGVSQLQ